MGSLAARTISQNPDVHSNSDLFRFSFFTKDEK
ncbi:hypothetical protein FIU95_00570 [Microbulbifer sp. THAF38]|nr:hypothetical protein FIU95_00570 [Microbulbifer sp. THAF38]